MLMIERLITTGKAEMDLVPIDSIGIVTSQLPQGYIVSVATGDRKTVTLHFRKMTGVEIGEAISAGEYCPMIQMLDNHLAAEEDELTCLYEDDLDQRVQNQGS